ncbi:MAG: hypothetical protein WBW32_20120, partial [Luteibacter sp.]
MKRLLIACAIFAVAAPLWAQTQREATQPTAQPANTENAPAQGARIATPAQARQASQGAVAPAR